MDQLEHRQHLLHSTLPAFARKLDWTRQLIEDALPKMGDNPQVSFSGGVDSTVLLDLLWQAEHPLPVLWGDDGADFPETLAFLKETEQRYGFRLVRVRSMAPWRSWCEEMARPDLADDPEAYEAWMNPRAWDDTWHTLTRDAIRHGYTGVFMGMLASESRNRRIVLRGGGRPLYPVKSGQINCSPLAAWTKADVWAYVARYDLPYNPVYDILATLGVPLERRRVAPLTCFRVLRFGSGVILRAGWPDLFNQLIATFPGLSIYR